MEAKQTQELITIKELAEKLRINPGTARNLYRRKLFPGVKLGYRTLRFDFSEVIDSLKHRNETQTK